MNQEQEVKKAQFKGHCIGVLQAASFMQKFHGECTLAEELISELLQGVSISALKRVAKHENIEIKWNKFLKLKKLCGKN